MSVEDIYNVYMIKYSFTAEICVYIFMYLSEYVMHMCMWPSVILHAWGGHSCFRAARKGGRNLNESMSYFCML